MNGNLLIKNAAQMLTMRGNGAAQLGMIENGWLLAQDGMIRGIGTEADVKKMANSLSNLTVIDAKGKTVLPGFVDCHTHIMFGQSRVKEYVVKLTDDRPEALAQLGIKTGIHASVEMTREVPIGALSAQTEKRLIGMMLHGTTTIESKSGYGLTTESELQMLRLNRRLNEKLPIDIYSTLLGAHGWPQDESKEEYMERIIREMMPVIQEEKLARFNDIWCDEGHYTAKESERILRAGMDFGLIPRIHTDAYSYIGGSDLAAEMGMASADHLNYTPQAVYQKLADADVTGVILVGTEFSVRHPHPANIRAMLNAGMTLALATNCCPSCWAESMPFILILACRQSGFSPAEAVRAATYGGAKVLRLSDRGILDAGKKADIQIWDTDTYENVVYQYGRNLVESVIKNGDPIVLNGKLIAD